MNDEEYCVCPYNSAHHIIRFRMPGHMMKCRKNYRGPPLEQCMYNAMHLVPVGTLAAHQENCRDGHQFNNTQLEKMAERCRPKSAPGED